MDKINILGVNVTNISPSQALNKIQEILSGQKQFFIATPNPEIILAATERDEELWYILNHADIALADGIALKFASWFYGQSVKRTTGADLLVKILELAQAEKKKVAIFNWQEGLSTGTEIKRVLSHKFPGLDVFVQEIDRPGPYNFSAVNNFSPEIVFCSLGFPFQEKFIYYNLNKIPSAKIGMSVGGSFDFLTGRTKRAPKIVRQIGLEWWWRLIKQPQRIGRIYRATIVFPWRFFIFFFILRWFYRPNVAGLLYKKVATTTDGKVRFKILAVRRVGEEEHWQLPQGGTDGESLFVAGARELAEELNTKNFKAIAIFNNLFQYKFSGFNSGGQPVKNQRGYKGQRQGLFIAEFIGQDSEIKINCWEHTDWRWVDAEKLVESLHPVRREAAKIFMEKFWEAVS